MDNRHYILIECIIGMFVGVVITLPLIAAF